MNTIQLIFTQPWAERLGWTLLHFVWQGAAICVLFITARALAGGGLSPKGRYALACTALAAMVAAPLATFGVLANLEPASAHLAGTASLTGGVVNSVAGAAAAQSDAWRQTLPWLVLAWLSGVVVFSVRLIGGWFRTARLRSVNNREAPCEWQQTVDRLIHRIGISQPVRLMVSSLVEVPAVVGWLRPVILMPIGALTGLAADHVEALLAHELAHVWRRDYLVNLMQSVAEAVLFYHPAVWWLSAQIRNERELCCDDIAVAVSGDVLTYAHALAELESYRPAHVRTAVAANGGGLLNRIGRLLGQPQPASHTLPGPAAAWALSILLLAGIGAVVLRGAQDNGAERARQAAQTGRSTPQEVTIGRDTIWIDTAKLGDMPLMVRGLGVATTPNTVELKIAETQMKDVRIGQTVTIDRLKGQALLTGVVYRIGAGATNGTVTVDVKLTGAQAAQAGEPVDATIMIDNLVNIVHVGRPAMGQAHSEGTLYKLEPDGKQAVRVTVRFGRSSVNQIEILSGLQPGDKVILSDPAAFKGADRISLK